ncbi:MAG TPA: membrane protein insertion efficiency factor YidD, partial [Methyloceanibacter sp.]
STLSPLLGVNCRHLPTCSDYAREAIDRNGAWKGGWLALARFCRCHPWGSHGFDPVPDMRGVHHPFAPWRYGRAAAPTSLLPALVRRSGSKTDVPNFPDIS